MSKIIFYSYIEKLILHVRKHLFVYRKHLFVYRLFSSSRFDNDQYHGSIIQ